MINELEVLTRVVELVGWMMRIEVIKLGWGYFDGVAFLLFSNFSVQVFRNWGIDDFRDLCRIHAVSSNTENPVINRKDRLLLKHRLDFLFSLLISSTPSFHLQFENL